MTQIKAPWTDEQVAALNRYQRGPMHPFTCGALPEKHPVPSKALRLTEDGQRDLDEWRSYEQGRTLIAKNDGWHCPTCDYTQDWAHAFMLDEVRQTQREKDAALFGFYLRQTRAKNADADSK